MKRKQNNLDKVFNLIGQAVVFILFCTGWTSILLYGIMTATTL